MLKKKNCSQKKLVKISQYGQLLSLEQDINFEIWTYCKKIIVYHGTMLKLPKLLRTIISVENVCTSTLHA